MTKHTKVERKRLTENVNVAMTTVQKEKLENLAKEAEKTISEYVRDELLGGN